MVDALVLKIWMGREKLFPYYFRQVRHDVISFISLV